MTSGLATFKGTRQSVVLHCLYMVVKTLVARSIQIKNFICCHLCRKCVNLREMFGKEHDLTSQCVDKMPPNITFMETRIQRLLFDLIF